MKKIEKALLAGSAYTVGIVALFYLFAAITEFVSPAITTGQFFLILLFGMIISFTGFFCSLLKFNKVIRCLIHYSVLLVAFCFIFIISGNIASGRASAVFVAIVLYTALYFFGWFTVMLIKKSISGLDAKLDAKQSTRKKQVKEPYKPIYKDE